MEKTRGSGNVFTDLGFGTEESENLKVRADLMIALTRYIRDQELTQQQTAERFGVTQPRISDLMRGRIQLFSIDTLVNMLASAGLHVTFEVVPV